MSQVHHLIRRGGVWHYRRRVPQDLISAIGKKEIQFSLKTGELAVAKKRRAVEDLKTITLFEHARQQHCGDVTAPPQGAEVKPAARLSELEVIRLVQQYVAGKDESARASYIADPPITREEAREIREGIETGLTILQNQDDPRSDEWVSEACDTILRGVGHSIDEASLYAGFAAWVRRGLIELQRRGCGRAVDDHQHPFFDPVFDPRRPPDLTFSEISKQYLAMTEDEAAANGTNQKWVDKQEANVALLTDIIGGNTPISNVDYDACLRVRSMLARVPANRNKLYPGLSIDEAVAQRAADGKPLLSAVTQTQYLSTLNAILDLAAKKRLIGFNPADGMTPLKRDTVAASDKRRPFSPEQLKKFFQSAFYLSCANNQPAFAGDSEGWRFWLPLLCLFMGLRPNEASQLSAADVKQTAAGTWFVEVTEFGDDDEPGVAIAKQLKTHTSRRRIPVHSELIAIGFTKFADGRRAAGPGARLFPTLKPDEYRRNPGGRERSPRWHGHRS